MSIILIDGPDKVGKTTLVNELVETYGYLKRKLSGPMRTDFEYMQMAGWDYMSTETTVWDRSWASEYAHGVPLGRENPITRDIVTPTWLEDFTSGGLKFMLLGESVESIESRLTEEDRKAMPNVRLCRDLFVAYAKANNWIVSYGYPHVEVLKIVAKWEADRKEGW